MKYYLDLLFYNLKVRRYVVIELKTTEFKPEYAGKLNFYLSAVDKYIKDKNDNPTFGILLCKDKKKVTAELALKDINKPIGVSEYKMKLNGKKKEKIVNIIGDVNANTINFDSNNMYYMKTNENGAFGIYKISLKGKNETELTNINTYSSNINVIDKWLYYLDVDEEYNSSIYRIKVNGKDKQSLEL